MGKAALIVAASLLAGCAERALAIPDDEGDLAVAGSPDFAMPSPLDFAMATKDLSAPDLTPACVASLTNQLPAPDTEEVPTTTAIQVKLACDDHPPDHARFSIELAAGAHAVDGSGMWDASDPVLRFVSAEPLALATTYTVTVRDAFGPPTSWQFTTRDGTWRSPAPVATLYAGSELSLAVSRNGHGVIAFGGDNADSLVVSALRFDFDAGFSPADPVRSIVPVDLHQLYAGIDDSGGVLLGWIEYSIVNRAGVYSVWTGRSASPGSWSVAADVLNDPGLDWFYGLALRSDGSGLMVWRDGQRRLLAKNSNPGSLPFVVAQGGSFADAALDPAGGAWVTWEGITDINVRWQGASGDWQPAQQLSSSGGSSPRISTGANGIAMASWEQVAFDGTFNDGNGVVRRYTPSQGWGTAQALDTQDTQGRDGSNEVRTLQTGIDDDGDALALWVNTVTYVTQRDANSTLYDTAYDLRSQRFAAGAWAPAHEQLDPGAASSRAGIYVVMSSRALAMAAQGNGFAVWLSGSQIRAARFLRSTGWQDPVLVDSGATQPPLVAIDAAGRAAAAWWVGAELHAALFTDQ